MNWPAIATSKHEVAPQQGSNHVEIGAPGFTFVQSLSFISVGACFAQDWSWKKKMTSKHKFSEAWEPPQFPEKRSRSEKAILGALGEFRGILGAALGIRISILGIRDSILGIRNSILGMASHDLSNTKAKIFGATPGAIPGIDGDPHERFLFAPAFSERFFKNWGGPRAPENLH